MAEVVGKRCEFRPRSNAPYEVFAKYGVLFNGDIG
jgi:hypothetical protein